MQNGLTTVFTPIMIVSPDYWALDGISTYHPPGLWTNIKPSRSFKPVLMSLYGSGSSVLHPRISWLHCVIWPCQLPAGKLLPMLILCCHWSHLGVGFITDLPASVSCLWMTFSKACHLVPMKRPQRCHSITPSGILASWTQKFWPFIFSAGSVHHPGSEVPSLS